MEIPAGKREVVACAVLPLVISVKGWPAKIDLIKALAKTPEGKMERVVNTARPILHYIKEYSGLERKKILDDIINGRPVVVPSNAARIRD